MAFNIAILCVSLLATIYSANAGTLRGAASRIYIGAAIDPHYLTSEPAYKSLAAQQFNCLTPENEMKWGSIEPNRGQVNYGPADQLVQFAQTSGLKVRGHTLVWHSQLPGWVNGLSKTDLETAMKKHITDEMTHFKGKIYAWDVVNEIFNEDGTYRDSVWHKQMGTNFVAEAFKLAHQVDPTAKLYINDYNIESHNKKSDALYNLVKQLKSQGVPVQGVGFQSHFISGSVPQDLQSNMKRFADLGLDVAITELDIRMSMPENEAKNQQQAKDYAFSIKACKAIPTCVGVTIWGMSDKHSWVPSTFPSQGAALPWDANYKPKAAVAAIEAALMG